MCLRFLICKMSNNITYLIKLSWGLTKLIYIKHLDQCLASSVSCCCCYCKASWVELYTWHNLYIVLLHTFILKYREIAIVLIIQFLYFIGITVDIDISEGYGLISLWLPYRILKSGTEMWIIWWLAKFFWLTPTKQPFSRCASHLCFSKITHYYVESWVTYK